MKPVLILGCILALCDRLVTGQQQQGNSTCPAKCTCSDDTLTCRAVSQLPPLDTPSELHRFTTFLFYDCDIRQLTRFPAGYLNATDLLVSNSGLDTITDDAFVGMEQLRVLELPGNRLRNVSKGTLSQLKNLVKLDISLNRLSQLPNEIFKELPRLEELRLDGNQLMFGDNLFEGTASLTKFSCNTCNLRSIPGKSLEKIKNLKHLELNQNAMYSLYENSFEAFDSSSHPLLELSLDNCSLSDVAKTSLRPFKNLRSLNLGHNELKSIPVGTFKYFWNTLRQLYVENNLLKVVDENLAPWKSLDELKLGHNPWDCTCEMAWIKDIPLEKIDKENVTCYTPPELEGHNLHTVAEKMNCPNRKYFLFLGFGIPALAIGVIVSACCLIKLSNRSNLRRGDSFKYRPVQPHSESNSRQNLV